jgi:hypothetical protein
MRMGEFRFRTIVVSGSPKTSTNAPRVIIARPLQADRRHQVDVASSIEEFR